MAYRSQNSSPSGSRSSPSATGSSNVSPASHTAALAPLTMAPAPEDIDSPPRGARITPSRQPIDLPRAQAASKGGCWTCRLRRKKCDEQREGDSCRTCIRLTIECLGWGPKRPEWMRDKQAVEEYKANIKAQLTRAGLIRGQPRSSLINTNPAQMVASHTRPQPYHLASAPDFSTSTSLQLDLPQYPYGYNNPPPGHRHTVIPGMPGASNPTFHQDTLYRDPNINALDLHGSFIPLSPQSAPPLSSASSYSQDSINIDFPNLGGTQDHSGFEFDLRPPSPLPSLPLISGQNSVQGDHVMYYFEHVRKLQYIFAGNSFTNATYSLIVQEPRGAVTNAVCALANLHFTRMRVAQGLEEVDPNPEHSNATYFHNEAYFQLDTAKQIHGGYNDSDAIAALHLISFSQLSGGVADWQRGFAVVCEWLGQTGLLTDDNPLRTLHGMSSITQLIVKAALWLDTFSSITLVCPPRYFALWKRLFGGAYWLPPTNDLDYPCHLRIDLLTGCPDEAMLAIAEITALAHWKATEQNNGTLSYRELIRQGDVIEQRLRQQHLDLRNFGEIDPAPLHPNLQPSSVSDSGVVLFPNEEVRRQVSNIFTETAVLLLHTVLSDSNPGVPEISESVGMIVRLLHQLPPSNVDRALIFPICLAGCMTNDSTHRDIFKGRLQALDNAVGNLMQVCIVMETVWQKRDMSCTAVDLRDIARECGLNLLLV